MVDDFLQQPIEIFTPAAGGGQAPEDWPGHWTGQSLVMQDSDLASRRKRAQSQVFEAFEAFEAVITNVVEKDTRDEELDKTLWE